jgi:hypothetical protein
MSAHPVFTEPVADVMQVMPVQIAGHAVPPGAKAMQEGKGDQEQENKPQVIRGGWLGQNGKRRIHGIDLPDSQL